MSVREERREKSNVLYVCERGKEGGTQCIV